MTRRIMIALDTSPASRAALESGARLAAGISAEIFGLFIEDTDIISAAGLPGTSIISYQGAQSGPLDVDTLMSSLRARARRLREEVERIADVYRIPWRFETARGRVSEEILRAATTSEMIAMGFSSFRSGQTAFGSTASAIVERAHCSVLLVRQQALQPAKRIVVLAVGSPRALEIGERLARMTGAELAVQETPKDRALALDLLVRLSPSYLVIDRASLGALGVTARGLGELLRVEGLIVTNGAPA